MEIRFERTEEDFVKFNLYHLSNSPSVKQQILWTQIFMTIIPFIVFYIINEGNSFIYYLVAAVIAGVFVFSYPFFYRKYTKWQTKNFLKEGNNKSVLGYNVVKLTPEGIFGNHSLENQRSTGHLLIIYGKTMSIFLFTLVSVL